ncbi:hypothetical protein SAMN02982929_02412 [Saccharopolyspora kobensis]|uniref:PAAR motif-containing protein n=1 Tax=Saccharopolyspora kobensis TaxID=146035 RepID=A0A1H6AQ32_9PSEU|nr:hypothetical protein [Saccharopolyspora kobensis]SEG50165.1 hypothetical protein SAMN02982929_02412 [Saccharopolyspora kobensis]SFE75630.1 hypothetical protein SAMN05216506_11420 [Saccharopolyspora kobensis]
MTGRGNFIHASTALHCPHGGPVVAASAAAAVRVDGQPVRTAGDVFAVRGCPHVARGRPDPCLTVRWSPPRDAVLIDGVPVLLDSTDGQCFGADLLPRGRPVARTGGQEVSSL